MEANVTEAPAAPTLFVRKASGLVKSWSGIDAFIYATLSVNLVALGLYYSFSYAPFVPHGQILTAVLVSGVFVSFLVVVYSALISTMPRAGGDYLWQSRVLGGGVAFVLAITGWCFILWHWAPIYGNILVVEVLQPIFTTLELPKTAAWFASNDGIFFTSLGVILFVGVLVALGMEGYARFQKAAFWAAALGLVILFALLLFGSQGAFHDAVNREAGDLFGTSGDAYSKTIAAAHHSGYDAPGVGISPIGPSMALVPIVLFFLLYPNWGATLYGEIRGAGSFSRVFWPMFAGLWVTVALAVAFIFLADKTFGWTFYMSASSDFWNGVGAGAGVPTIFPFPGLMAGWLVDSPVFQIGLILLLSMWFFAWAGTLFLSSTRVIFAAAFDRILPEWAAAVSEKRRVPVGALLIMLVPSIAVSAMYAYSKHFANYTLAATLVIAVSFVGSVVAATLLPWRRPGMWANSPASRLRLGRIPLVPLAGLATLGFLGWTLYKWLTEDVYFLNKPKSLIYMGSLYGLALLVYLVARLIRWRQGVPLKAIHSEIPAE